ncbi:uncharacterized protein BDW70DRAFT_166351 [Aspergillus foveolatus]|uniref:uncharacterized protein n=1 Tax=Aspergillus foveolatus TaxID=210207 RepID=UPI003CCD25C9
MIHALIAAVLLGPSVGALTSTPSCCYKLSAALGSKVSNPDSSTYNTSISSYWSQQEQPIKPSCIIVPRSCNFVIAAAGTGRLQGSLIKDAVTIDLGGLDSIQISQDASSISVGPDARGVSVPGGRDSPVGVRGTTLGTFNYFAPLAGFACDDVISYEVVLANGSIATATNRTHRDVWLALKGTGNNLGIVTNFVFRTFPLGITLDAQLTAFSLMLNFAYSVATGSLLMAQLSYAAQVQDPGAFRNLSIRTGQLAPPSFGQVVFAVTFENSLSMLHTTFDIRNTSTVSISHIPGIAWSLSLVPIVPAITAQSAVRGGNVLSLDDVPVQGLILAILSASFNSSADNAAVSAAAERLRNSIINAGTAEGVYNDYVDNNHPGHWQNPIASYGSSNWEIIRETAEKYDSDGVFQPVGHVS